MSGITPHQHKALTFIGDFIEVNGFSPNYAEIAGGLGYKSKAAAHRVVHQLVERGAITVLHGKDKIRGRSIDVVRAA